MTNRLPHHPSCSPIPNTAREFPDAIKGPLKQMLQQKPFVLRSPLVMEFVNDYQDCCKLEKHYHDRNIEYEIGEGNPSCEGWHSYGNVKVTPCQHDAAKSVENQNSTICNEDDGYEGFSSKCLLMVGTYV